jgi:hypothetical protein
MGVGMGGSALPVGGELVRLRGLSPRFLSARVTSSLDELRAEVLLGSQGVVRRATKREIGCSVLATQCEGLQVVELEAVCFPAALPRAVNVRAAPLVALEDGAADGGWDISPAPVRVVGTGPAAFSDIVRRSGGARVRLCQLPRRAQCSRALRRGALLSLELGHEAAQGAQLELVERNALRRAREERLGLLQRASRTPHRR